MTTKIFDQMNIKGSIRNVSKKKAMRLLKQVMDNNLKILELQKWLVMLQKKDAKKRKRAIMEKKYFVCRGFRHIIHHCRNKGRLRRIEEQKLGNQNVSP